MPDLSFEITGVEAVPFAAAPTLAFSLNVVNETPAESVQNVLLTTQVRIEANRRSYAAAEKEGLRDLFGEPHRWGQTLRPLLWTHVSGVIPPFQGDSSFDLDVPCSFDFNVAATKYFNALRQDDIPLLFLFSGTVFYAGEDGVLQAARISWSKEARFRLPAATWRKLMHLYYPNEVWLTVGKDVFDKLAAFKARTGLAGWDQAFERLLAESGAPHGELASK